MILLFEDRKERSKINIANIDKSILKNEIFNFKMEVGISVYIKNIYGSAAAVLFHTSYTFPRCNITVSEIKEEFYKLGIPFVLFGGGMYNNLNNSALYMSATVSSSTMYNNLPLLIDHYKACNKIDLRLLIFGNDFIKNSLFEFQRLIYARFFYFKDSDEIIGDDKILLIIDVIEPSIKDEGLKMAKEKLIRWLKDNMICFGMLKAYLKDLIESQIIY